MPPSRPMRFIAVALPATGRSGRLAPTAPHLPGSRRSRAKAEVRSGWRRLRGRERSRHAARSIIRRCLTTPACPARVGEAYIRQEVDMAAGLILEFDGVGREQYEAVNERLGIDPATGQ